MNITLMLQRIKNKAILKGTMVCDVTVYNKCKYKRFIYSKYMKGRKKYDILKEVQEDYLVSLQQ